MPQQLLSHTPIYVWAILAFLVYRGVLASTDRATTMRTLCIMPAVMLVLSLQGIAGKFDLGGGVLLAWAVGAAAGAALTWMLIDGARISADRARGTVHQRGSWTPLALMLSIFVIKYSVAVVTAMHPALAQSAAFALPVCALFGCCNGIFFGRLLRQAAAYFQQPYALAA
ncbi:DUF6622 family protein [Rugamonas sp.]|uniref:DUF6622 family protein n=1 Tax=Rugamonas sp. TaxID=1926287 RepID=UPI0025E34CF6|nr:DUF6622 family protein [Rugamonas sp.]